MAEITGGELLADALVAEGVKFVFGIPFPKLTRCSRNLPVRCALVPVRHEAAAVHMAEGLYKTTGQIAVVLGNPGPGSANLLPGVITARHEGVAVVVITAQHRLENVYPSPPSTFQGQDQLDVFKTVSKWSAPILSWNRIPEVMRIAFREMWNGRPGPVHLEIPSPVMYATDDDAKVRLIAPENYRAAGPQASQSQLEQAAEMLASAARPLILGGAGIDRANANGALMRIVDLLNCPVLGTMAGRSAVPLDHPNFLYTYSPAADAARREADVILVAGSRLGNLDIPYDKYWGNPSGQQLIQIDIDQRDMGVTRPLALGIVADAKNALEGLHRALAAKTVKSKSGDDLKRYQEASRQWREKAFAKARDYRGDKESIRLMRCKRSATFSAKMRSTSPMVGTLRYGHIGSCPRRGRALISTSSSWGCSGPGFHPRSARSSATPIAKSCASPVTERQDSTSWRCNPPRAKASRCAPSCSPRVRGRWKSRTSSSTTARRLGPRRARSAGTSWRKG